VEIPLFLPGEIGCPSTGNPFKTN